VIKVAFILDGHDWLGGVTYFRNLFSALALLPDPKIHPVLFVGTNVPDSVIDDFADIEILRTAALDSTTLIGLMRRVVRKIFFQRDFVLSQLLVWNKINVISHYAGALPTFTKIKAVGWIPDFQYLHLPTLFTDHDRKSRDTAVSRLLDTCDIILVSSETAQRDLASISPESLVKSRVLRFVPKVDGPSDALVMPLRELEDKYSISHPYFYLPNQFWAHKNHALVIQALSILKKRGDAVTVVATGATRDHRFPDHFSQLMSLAKNGDVLDCFKVLGVVPYQDLLALMQHSVAVINSSLFEGWSTTVEEAKALDKSILLSNISVHKEQHPFKGVYFDPNNSNELAAKMLEMLANSGLEAPGNTLRYSNAYQEKRLQFASIYQEIIVKLCADNVL
jgi:glycosyltransferase involved in cell wall biosynthesis